ncbi:ABC transporter permease [Mycolicibacterium goodii]|uniref:ABC transporter permease n=1 Tax=Mycolicibacterium goodii TaxID=134601 RepID=UPI0027DF1A00|nr:iron ABC transporter permease [Mycolicibacterium goodii]
MSVSTRLPDGPPRRALGYRARVALRNPTTAIGLLTLVLFGYLIAVPIVVLMIDGFRVERADEGITRKATGEPTTYYLWRVLRSPTAVDIFWTPLWNTVTIAFFSVLFALVVGGVAAWFIARSNVFGRKWFATALIVPYMLPSWTFALAWTTVFKNRTAGGQLGWMEQLGFVPGDWLAYGRLPIIVIFTMHFSPFVILLVGNALKRFDSQLEESARILGANRLAVTFTIIVPMMRPALISATTLILAKVLGEFGVAYILGLPVGFDVLATSLYRSIASDQTGVAAILVAAIVLIGLVSLWVDVHFLKEARRFVTIGGKGALNRAVDLGRWRAPATMWCAALFAVSVAVPIAVLCLSTVMKVPAEFTRDNFTLQYWIGRDLNTPAFPDGILVSPSVWSAVWNSFWIVGLASVAAGILGLLVGYVVVRSESRILSTVLRQLTFLPYLVPGIAFAVAYITLFAVPRGPIPALYGTTVILLLIYLADQMPFASRAGISAMMQLGRDAEESAQIMGAGWLRRMGTVVLPIQKGALAAGILMPFITGIKSLSLVVILAVPGGDVLTTLAIRLVDFGYTQSANGVVLIVAAVAFLGTYSIQKLLKTDLASGLEG